MKIKRKGKESLFLLFLECFPLLFLLLFLIILHIILFLPFLILPLHILILLLTILNLFPLLLLFHPHYFRLLLSVVLHDTR